MFYIININVNNVRKALHLQATFQVDPYEKKTFRIVILIVAKHQETNSLRLVHTYKITHFPQLLKLNRLMFKTNDYIDYMTKYNLYIYNIY